LANDPDAPPPSANVRAASYYIARSCVVCPHCAAATWLTALALPPGHETRDDDTDVWQAVPANAFLFYVAAVSSTVCRRLGRDAPSLRFASSETTGNSYWANRCQRCELLVGDDVLHGEPGVHGFALCSEAHAASIALIEVRERFEALAAGYTLEPEFFALMRRT
jgi:hypothetical protein